jgi:AcrR family transcriptional regulator
MAAGDRSAERRAEQRERLIDAAERRIAESGADALRARDLAQDIGVALGAIYNLVADLNELHLLVARRTMARLDAALEAAGRIRAGAPAMRLKAIAAAYLGFARDEARLWRDMFEAGRVAPEEVPVWLAEQQRLLRHIMQPLEALTPRWRPDDRRIFAHTLFTATHGIVTLSLEQRLVAVPAEAIERQLDILVDAVCAGLPEVV